MHQRKQGRNGEKTEAKNERRKERQAKKYNKFIGKKQTQKEEKKPY